MKAVSRRGLFITFEGIDGSGKSTQIELVYKYLTGLGYSARLLREPGSTAVSERIREILLDRTIDMADETELLLYEAARSEITRKEIAPAIQKGSIVLCDRFFDSTTAYQGYGRKLDVPMVRRLHRIAAGEFVPDLTFLFDVDLKTAINRRGQKVDRLESQSAAFFDRVRRGFLEIARKERKRFRVIDATQSVDRVFQAVSKHLTRKLRQYDSTSGV